MNINSNLDTDRNTTEALLEELVLKACLEFESLSNIGGIDSQNKCQGNLHSSDYWSTGLRLRGW